MRALGVKLQRDMRRAFGMLAAIVALIAVGISSFVCMRGAYDNLETAKDAFYADCRMADFWVDLKKAPSDDALRRCEIPGISALRTRISFPVLIDFADEVRPINAVAISMPAERKPVINDIIMRSGSYFTPDQRNQVIVSEKFAAARHLKPGDVLDVLVDGQLKPFVVVGTAIAAEYVYLVQPGSMMNEPDNYGLLYMKQDYAEEVFDFAGSCNSLVGQLTPERKRVGADDIYDEVTRRLEPYGLFCVTPLSRQLSNMSLASEMGALKSMATVLPVFFLAVAALALNVLMSRMAEQQRTIIGTLKALGYTDREVGNHFRLYGLIVGLCGGVIGCALGYWMAGGMVAMYQEIFTFPSLRNNMFPGLMTLGCAVGIVFAVRGSVRGVRQVARLNPSESMRQPAPPVGSKILLERCPRFWNRLDFSWQMLLRNLFRQKARTLMAVFAAMAGAALVLLSIGMMNSMSALIAWQFEKTLRADYALSFKDAVQSDALQAVRMCEGVGETEPLFEVVADLRHGHLSKKVMLTGLRRDAVLTRIYDREGRLVAVPPHGLALSDWLAETLELEAGDTVEFAPVRGGVTPRQVPVSLIAKSALGVPAYADLQWLETFMGEEEAITSIQVQGRMNDAQQRMFFERMKEAPMLQAITSVADQRKAISGQFKKSLQGMVFIMVLFAAVIFFGSILNGALIAISERTREIATFRVLGYSAAEISGVFLRENLLTNMTGALLGLPVGFWMLQGMLRQFRSDAFRFPCVVYPATWWQTLVLALLFVLSAQIIVHRQIARINWQEALSMKE